MSPPTLQDQAREAFDMNKKIQEFNDELKRCTYKPTKKDLHRLRIVKEVFKAISEHMERGGSFRVLIYGRLKFGYYAYTDLYLAGGMDISNMCNNVDRLKNVK